ncbi:MAG TPA: cysteine synthase B [Sulfurihydrogenibium sp.]|uniref:cysteine synthase B n=1 Tax=Sulfurihydrogenibium sp. (strain YO3AOP1) TaxID=436114 RepID=UPI00017232C6|nr:cysteine synthase B [Sulfurihydrogenibium sp. YO3AOP1]ACD66472.1 cysteine synthase B [Sulfurihydrogenibium sp. YO3AOP1]HBT98556.1 cysteine synthase B [Sulfurihydrogenibium sp.]
MWIFGQHDEGYRKTRKSILELVGNTPLVELSRSLPEDIKKKNVKIYAKLESYNPGGSVKDRPATRMIVEAINSGKLTKDKVIIDATSGNTGIALAMVGTALGYQVELAMPANVSEERKRIIKAFGAKIHFTNPLESTDGAIIYVRKLVEKYPEKYYYIDQYNNDANWKAHFDSTAVEIWNQTEGKITHFVAGIGTGGTVMGTGRRLKIFNPDIQVIGVQPDSPFHGIEGLKYIETSIKPGIFDENRLDRTIFIGTDIAYQRARELSRLEGIFVGQSSGAAYEAAIKVAREIDEGVIVFICPDGGEKYLTTALYDYE